MKEDETTTTGEEKNPALEGESWKST